MQRRETGVAVVAAAVLLAVIVPDLGGRSIPGRAQAIPIRPVPSVGECVLTPIAALRGPTGNSFFVADDDVRVGACQGSRYGEVSAVLDGRGAYVGGNTEGRYLSGNYGGAEYVCDYQTQDYQGVPASLRGGAAYANLWSATLSTLTLTMQPDDEQRAAGQNWTACIAVQVDDADNLTTFAESSRDLYRTGTPRPDSGSCLDVADAATARPVRCDRPHGAENFGLAVTAVGEVGTGDEGDLQRSCTELVALLTRAPDVGTEGGLEVFTATTYRDDNGTVIARPDSDSAGVLAYSSCQVVTPPGRTLSGTLVGLGDRPVPWT